MLKHLITTQKEQLDGYYQNIDLQQVEKIFEVIASCQGKLIFCGVGKSGIVAEKIAKTMTSTGTKAIALSAVDALHGDIGICEAQDLFIVLSKSGHTKELQELIRTVKLKKVRVMGWFCNPKAKLINQCDDVMQLPIENELCPFDLAPTTSTAVQLLFGDVIAIALMKKNQFSLSQYALNHPAGTIGKKSSLKVEDLMLTGEKLPICLPDAHLSDVLVELSNKRCGCVLVVNQKEELLGIFTDGDLRRALQKESDSVFTKTMQELMTQDVMSISDKALAMDAISIMQHNPRQRVLMLPVLNGKQLKGLITMHDIVNSGL